MASAAKAKKKLKEVFTSQKLGVLATDSDGQPYASLLAFIATKDIKHIVFATTRSTRKFANIVSNPRVAMLVNDSGNTEADFHEAVAVTATGKAREVTVRERKRFLKAYLEKHPHLEDFVTSPTCALVKLTVDCYYVVSRFQNVVELHPNK